MAGMVFGCKLHRWKSRVLTDLLGDHLVHRGVQLQHVALVGNRPAQESGAAYRVSRFTAVVQPRHDDDVVAEWFKRFQDWGKLKADTLFFGCPLLHDRAHRNVNKTEL